MVDLTRRHWLILSSALAISQNPVWAGVASGDAPLPTVWDLSALFADEQAWSTEREAVLAALPGLLAYKGRLGESATTLQAALQANSDISRRFRRLRVYATLSSDENLQDSHGQERRQLVRDLEGKISEASAWINPEVLTVGAAKITSFVAADPGLARFRFGLSDSARLAPHTLDGKGEDLLAAATQPMGAPMQIRNLLVLSDIPWPDINLAQGKIRLDGQGYTQARTSPDRGERKAVFDAFFGAFKSYESSLGACLSGQVQVNNFQAKARHYTSALDAALAADNIPEGVYRTLVAETHAGLPVLQRYFDVRRRMLGLSELAYYDLYPPVTKLDIRFDIAMSRRYTLEAVAPLGADYVDRLSKATMSGWMHAYPQKGKADGAYMDPSAYDVHPYLLLNHTDDYKGMTTFAHEWGHAMHSLLANAAQPFDTAAYATFIAEIASTVNEQLLAEHMYRSARTKEEKLFYLDRVCELLRGTFFRQAMFGEFELTIHETAERGEALTGAKMSEIYLDLLHRYHGKAVTIDPLYGIEWADPPHFFYDFYVYQYATSLAASVYFADKILSGSAHERDNYLDVLKAGGSDYPVDILKRAGLDMTTPAPYRALVAKFSRTLDEMEKLLA
jgi:oligoendopeptidase F